MLFDQRAHYRAWNINVDAVQFSVRSQTWLAPPAAEQRRLSSTDSQWALIRRYYWRMPVGDIRLRQCASTVASRLRMPSTCVAVVGTHCDLPSAVVCRRCEWLPSERVAEIAGSRRHSHVGSGRCSSSVAVAAAYIRDICGSSREPARAVSRRRQRVDHGRRRAASETLFSSFTACILWPHVQLNL